MVVVVVVAKATGRRLRFALKLRRRPGEPANSRRQSAAPKANTIKRHTQLGEEESFEGLAPPLPPLSFSYRFLFSCVPEQAAFHRAVRPERVLYAQTRVGTIRRTRPIPPPISINNVRSKRPSPFAPFFSLRAHKKNRESLVRMYVCTFVCA